MNKIRLYQFPMIAFAFVILMGPSPSRAMGSYSSASTGNNTVMIGISGMYLATSTDGSTIGNTDSTTTLLDGKIGYTFMENLYLGAIYATRSDSTNGAKNDRTAYGATIGYHNSGWFLDGTYFISSTYKYSDGTELTGGSGFGVDLGHNFDITANIYLGLQASYRSFTYNKKASIDETNKYKSEISPMLNLGIMF